MAPGRPVSPPHFKAKGRGAPVTAEARSAEALALHYYPGNASLAPHLVLKALGVPYRLVLVDREAHVQKSEAYLGLNPLGRIPVLVQEGKAVWESAAITLLLADTHPRSQMAPGPQHPDRGAFLQWLMFFTNTLQPALMEFHYPGEGRGSLSLRERSAAVRDLWAVVEAHLQAPLLWRQGGGLSALGAYSFMLAWWSRTFLPLMTEQRGLTDFLVKASREPAVRGVFEQEGLDLKELRPGAGR